MKACHENNDAAIYVGSGRDRAQSFVSTVHITAELNILLNRNVSVVQLFQHISKSIVVCARSRPKMLIKTRI